MDMTIETKIAALSRQIETLAAEVSDHQLAVLRSRRQLAPLAGDVAKLRRQIAADEQADEHLVELRRLDEIIETWTMT